MSYRSFKRVLGETNLERKCLVLFGACLFLLITGAFWYAERIAEHLVKEKTHQTGRDFVDLSVLRYHFEHIDPLGETTDPSSHESWKRWVEAIDRDLTTQNYVWEILLLDPVGNIDKAMDQTRIPTKKERSIMQKLQREQEEQVREQPISAESATAGEVQPVPNSNPSQSAETIAAEGDPATTPDKENEPVERLVPVSHLEARRDNYYYFQPVYWRETCVTCHKMNGGVFQEAEQEPHEELRGPLRVVKVTIPSGETQTAVIRSRAILLATAIITVFLSVIILYLVVRYVVVKPLNHLRDVSDEISRGNTNLRADIQTNDEFEDLAASFNRMLRHLVDTQEALRNVNVDLDGKLDQLAQANMQLHEMNRLKSDFLANMSHELRTPLNSIIGFSDVLAGIDALNGKQKRYVNNIGTSGRILLEMINDILDLAKMENGKMDVRLTDFSIGPVVKAQCDLVRALSEEKNIDLTVNVEANLPGMHQDQSKVQQILTNLLSNAIKFTPEGGRISVTADRDHEGFLVLTVEDTGVGISEDDRKIIFEKFRQGSTILGGDNLTRQFSGTGLGLSIVKELCRLLGGEVSFESELGKGSKFTARLPWHRKASPRLESTLAARLEEVTKTQRTHAMRGTNTGLTEPTPTEPSLPDSPSTSGESVLPTSPNG
ncbi:MAG: HAMP domain-containing histidine kinase [Planctomycetaceae bacterium]|nr:HAMP domain-containing histidine kinase [Planctomycetaceae bacterium]